ncbi:cuticle protein 19-like [Culex quinquefasciatus]|uniref:cuticle protein 19-like n=1 Tax=Culex quinquefasciatus TaxID=7176 RepID=UPI0018E2E5F3|nr:cuticle protein 19-like [Culex quinquefasciatus]
MFKIALFALFCLLATVSAQYWGGEGYHHEDHHSYPKYKYEYGVKDHHTGDHKSQWESRDGDVVKGGYTLDEADGTKRVVEYHSDKHHGLTAHVKRIGHAHHPQVYGHQHYGGGYQNQGYQGYGHGSGYSYSNLNQHF